MARAGDIGDAGEGAEPRKVVSLWQCPVPGCENPGRAIWRNFCREHESLPAEEKLRLRGAQMAAKGNGPQRVKKGSGFFVDKLQHLHDEKRLDLGMELVGVTKIVEAVAWAEGRRKPYSNTTLMEWRTREVHPLPAGSLRANHPQCTLRTICRWVAEEYMLRREVLPWESPIRGLGIVPFPDGEDPELRPAPKVFKNPVVQAKMEAELAASSMFGGAGGKKR